MQLSCAEKEPFGVTGEQMHTAMILLDFAAILPTSRNEVGRCWADLQTLKRITGPAGLDSSRDREEPSRVHIYQCVVEEK